VNSFRVFVIGGLMSYRALFHWQNPAFYIPTMVGHPLFQVLFFAYLGRFSHVRNDSFFVVGNAVQVSAMSGVYGMAMTIGGERSTQTLAPLLATPANRMVLFLGRALPHILNGLTVSAFGFLVGRLLLDFHPPASSIPRLALVVVISTASCTAFGLVVGAFGLRLRDVFSLSNPAYFLMLLFCGVNIPIELLPPWMEAVSRCLPLTHGIMAAREVAAGATPADVSGLVWTEVGVGAAYAVAAFGLFRLLERESRRSAVLDSL
jgi:ABC-2 type transport system permease protein